MKKIDDLNENIKKNNQVNFDTIKLIENDLIDLKKRTQSLKKVYPDFKKYKNPNLITKNLGKTISSQQKLPIFNNNKLKQIEDIGFKLTDSIKIESSIEIISGNELQVKKVRSRREKLKTNIIPSLFQIQKKKK